MALGDQRAAEVVPRRVAAGLRVDAPRGDGREVGERLQQEVVGALAAGALEREVGGAVGAVLRADAPLGLGQVDGGRRQLEQPAARQHAVDGAPQPDERRRVLALLQQREAVPGVEHLADVREPAGAELGLQALDHGAGGGRVVFEAQRELGLGDAVEQLEDQRAAAARDLAPAHERVVGVRRAPGVDQDLRADRGVQADGGHAGRLRVLVELERALRAPGGAQRPDPPRARHRLDPPRGGRLGELGEAAEVVAGAQQQRVNRAARRHRRRQRRLPRRSSSGSIA